MRTVTGLKAVGRVVETDILVIGGGVAGLWSAIRARENVSRVLVVDKGPRDWGGQASRSGGAMVAAVPPDTPEDFIKDLVYYYDGLCDQELWGWIFKESYERLKDYERLGYEFIADDRGRRKGIPQRGLDHVKCYLGKPFGMGGKNMVAVLVQEAERLGIERLGRIVITDILRRDGTTVGACGFDAISGEFYVFKARAVILAVGNGGWKVSYHHNTCAGDTAYLGLNAGAEATSCEFARVWNVPRLFGWEGQTYLLPLGAKFVNGLGETFMDRYSPVLGANTDPHYITRAMALEAEKGRGPFYLDCTGMSPENRELVTPKGHGWMELNYLRLRDMGMRFFEDKLEWIAQMRLSVMGIAADHAGRTTVPGLFVTGRARATDPTVYIGGLSLCLCAVTGHATGEAAGLYAASRRKIALNEGDVSEKKKRLFAQMGGKGISPKEVLREIQAIVFPHDVSILKQGESLTRASRQLDRLEAETVPHMAARDAHYLMKLMEVRSILLMSQLYVRASLARTESRAGHFRADYPERNDRKWLSQIFVSRRKDSFAMRTEPLPVDRYPVKATRYYSDNFSFPQHTDG